LSLGSSIRLAPLKPFAPWLNFACMPTARQVRACISLACGLLALRAVGAQDSSAWRPLHPALSVTWRDGVPDARGDGAAETRPGGLVRLSGGVAYSRGHFGIRFEPELVASSTRDHPVFAGGDPARHPESSPWYHGSYSADLPWRRHDVTRLWLGESGAWWNAGSLKLELTTSQPRWGPGQGEGLVLGQSAPGVPRAEASWARGIGPTERVVVRWFSGALRESDRFDADPDNDRRALAGARVEYHREAGADGLAIVAGLSRTVMDGRAEVSVLTSSVAPFASARRDSLLEMVGADVELAHASAGTVAWLEFARQTPLGSLRSFLLSPIEGLAFRFGVSQRLHAAPRATWTGTLEFVLLDQPEQRADVQQPDLYTSPTVAHGWTHHGQPLGSGLGPGGQRQFARLVREGPAWTLGAFAERARWNDDAMLRLPDASSDRHDVTIQLGLDAARDLGRYRVGAMVSGGRRMNYLFQGPSATPDQRGVDVRVVQLGLRITPLP
jgi:hypothetical protein